MINITRGRISIPSVRDSMYGGGKKEFEFTTDDGTDIVLGWDIVSHVAQCLIYLNKIESLSGLQAFEE